MARNIGHTCLGARNATWYGSNRAEELLSSIHLAARIRPALFRRGPVESVMVALEQLVDNFQLQSELRNARHIGACGVIRIRHHRVDSESESTAL
jgi:hypothetical protein